MQAQTLHSETVKIFQINFEDDLVQTSADVCVAAEETRVSQIPSRLVSCAVCSFVVRVRNSTFLHN